MSHSTETIVGSAISQANSRKQSTALAGRVGDLTFRRIVDRTNWAWLYFGRTSVCISMVALDPHDF